MADAEATIWASQLASGLLPPICVKTGQPVERWVKVTFSTVPGWTWVFIFFGVLPLALIRYALAKTARGRLPYSETVGGRVTIARWLVWIGVVGGIVLFFVGLFTLSENATYGAVIMIVAGLLILAGIVVSFYLRLALLPRARVLDDPRVPDRWVVLTGVHPAFAEAVRRGPTG